MSNDDIRMAQVRAGEQVIADRLRAKGLIVDDDNRPRCPGEATLDEVRDEYHQLHQVRHGQIAVYPQDHMRRLLAGEAKAPLLRRLLRRLRLIR